MQSQNNIKPWMWTFAMLFMVLFSCKDYMAEHYETPSYLVGSAWDDLTQRGDYDIFLEGVEKAGFKKLVSGRGLVNVMAPNDSAFTAYLQRKGYSTIDEIPSVELNKLIGYHLLFDTYNKNEYAHYNPYGSGNEIPSEMGLYYKHRSNARNPISEEFDPVTKDTVKVYHKDLFLPVFSNYIFANKEIDPVENYEYFYPNSTWTGDLEGFNVSEASVLEYEQITDNGFVYLIDRVLEPLETIHQSLKDKGNYSRFLSMYDRFSNFWLDENATDKYGNGEDLYIHQHSGLPLIASEWPYNGEGAFQDFENLPALTGEAFSAFVPSNNALEQFYQDFWADYYPSLDAVNFLPVGWLLYNHVYEGSILFPEEIRRGGLLTFLGTPIDFDPDGDVDLSQVCANGAYYGLNKVLVPDMYKSITGPVFQNPEYTMFLHMVATTGLFLPLSSTALDYTIFIPDDSVMTASGYYDLAMRYFDLDTAVFGDEAVQVDDGGWGDLGSSAMEFYVNSHVSTERITTVNGTDVYKSGNAYSYIYTRGNTIASNALFNDDKEFVAMTPIPGDWINGTAYNIDTTLLMENRSFKVQVVSADEVPYLKDYEEFSKLLVNAGLLPVGNPLDFLLDNYMVFVPSNEAILNAPAGLIPTEQDELAAFLKYYFVNVATNQLSDYAFPGAGIQGTLDTYQDYNPADTIPLATITLTDNGSNLTLTNSTASQTATVISELPKVYEDGAVYVIDALIQPE